MLTAAMAASPVLATMAVDNTPIKRMKNWSRNRVKNIPRNS